MTNQDSDGLFDNDGDDRGELAWTEADWELYLTEQDNAVRQYQKHYDELGTATDRIDEAARRMGWEINDSAISDNAVEEDDAAEDAFEDDWEPYTLHRNPVFVATRALYASLLNEWERTAASPEQVPSAIGLEVQTSLHRGNEHALHAIQSLEMGDYALALCFFKRALRELNTTLARVNQPDVTAASPALTAFRDFALPRLFDLREIWLRVMHECRGAKDE